MKFVDSYPARTIDKAHGHPVGWRFRGKLAMAAKFLSRPLVVGIGLSMVGLLLHHRWLTVDPLSAGDWRWVSQGRAASWWPWPSVWDSTMGYGTKTFQTLYSNPILALGGVLGRVGIPWGFSEKLLFFWPFAVLVLLGPWLLGRSILKDSRWALLSALIFASNTYVLLLARMQLTVAMAEVLGFLVILPFQRALRERSIRWALVTGAVLSIQCAYDIRITYLTAILMLAYLAVVVVGDLDRGRAVARCALTIATFGVLFAIGAYWWLPLITYAGQPQLPIPSTPWLAFMELAHGLTGLHPFWTGQVPADFRTTPFNPTYLLFAILAFIPLLARRFRAEVIWLSASLVLAAFLLKQDTPPFGQLYNWMFAHIPGWNLFREASKLFFVVAMAQAILIPTALIMIFHANPKRRFLRAVLRGFAVMSLVATCALAGTAFLPLLNGQLGYASEPTVMPESFAGLSRVLDKDRGYGPVLWLGGPVFWRNSQDHYFAVTSPRHPIVSLGGNLDSGDPLAGFCSAPDLPYCYLGDRMLPFLLRRTDASYLVAPLGEHIGTLPPDVSRSWLRDEVGRILGPYRVFGEGGDAVAVWKLAPGSLPVTGSKAIALVAGDVGTTQAAIPALDALGIPAIYSPSGSLGSVSDAVGRVITVVPPINGTCKASRSGDYAVLASTSRPSLRIVQSGREATLPLLSQPGRVPGWGVYGPLHLDANSGVMEMPPNVELGPCVSWSAVTSDVLADENPKAVPTTEQVSNETVQARLDTRANPWVELKRSYDPAWRVEGAAVHVQGDQLFNLYYVGSDKLGTIENSGNELRFTFSTQPWEGYGIIASIVATLAALVGIALIKGKGRRRSLTLVVDERVAPLFERSRDLVLAAILLVGLAALAEVLARLGIPSRLPWLMFAGDPYAMADLYLSVSIALFLLAIALRLIQRGTTK